ncbi:TlpA family protein disulfide reductase [Pedobacter sp. CCM 8938]|uniref:TlpA family protein disulfide reductase n=2 Tax=Pedobacter fastidiosus TaxID=2765361 RepID=A0ABR7KV99_9SPHI|nr:TlpA disulfide reductase family protein [Pedobacter fastidiosus]MBC6111755.1 TlpA family protein disulfide reductase [Pedobacter fastidiosus]
MKTYIVTFLLLATSFFAKAQDAPVRWATQETFFEDLVGKDLPDFKGLTVNKISFKREALKNEIVLINFWFEKCPPCIAEMPELNKLVDKYAKQKVKFIAITYNLPSSAKRFQNRNGYKYEVVSLTKEELRKLNINHGFPSNILVGRDGKILYATANISFSDPDFKAKSILLEEKLKAEIEKSGH